MAEGWSVLVNKSVVLPANFATPAAFLRSNAPGAYTTTRTSKEGTSLLLWDRHMARLSESLHLLHKNDPHLYPNVGSLTDVKELVEPSVAKTLAKASEHRKPEEEIMLCILVCGLGSETEQQASENCDVFVFASNFVPCSENEIPAGVPVAVMGPGRKLARAKDSLWASTRQGLERVRPTNRHEIVLSNDGDHMLEGLVTNFYVVKLRDDSQNSALEGFDGHAYELTTFEVLTSPLSDGVLNGVIRKVIIEVCEEAGIVLHERSPSWSTRHTWREAFVTNGLRIVQPVTKIQMPGVWPDDFDPKRFRETEWQMLDLEVCGRVTRHIHTLVMERLSQLSTPATKLVEG